MVTKIRVKPFLLFLCMSAILFIISGCSSDSKSPTSVLSSIEISPSSINIMINESIELTAVGRDQDGEIMNIEPVWSIAGEVGAISPTTGNNVTFTSGSTEGSGELTAYVGDISASVSITVSREAAVISSIEISPASVSVAEGDTQDFTATGKDQYGEDISFSTSPAWSITDNIGNISLTEGNSTTFTAETVGEGSISVVVGDIIGTADITVTQQPPILTRIEISPDSDLSEDIYNNYNVNFTVNGYDQYDQQMSCNPSWSISPELGAFSPASGESTTFNANTTGTATITAADGTITDSVNITIIEAPGLDEIVINPASLEIYEDEEAYLFTASGYDQYGDRYPVDAAWSVTGDIGTVTPTSGSSTYFTPTTPGTGTIVVSEEEISDTAEITVKPTTLYVPDDYGTIQEAIDAAVNGMTIIVNEDTYNESISIMNKNITLQSTDPGNPTVVANTIIDAGGNGSTIVISGAETNIVTIEGLTITGGNGSNQIGSTSHYGGGINIHTAETILRHNVITGNEAYNGGGGIYGYMCDMTLEVNSIENNSSYLTGGGISIGADSGYTLNIDMTDNIIRNNESEDRNVGGIYTSNVEGTWTGNIINGNSALTNTGGIKLNHSSPDIINNQIINNTAGDSIGGISVDANSFPTIQNNIISGNEAALTNSYGGGLSIASEGLILSGNEISNNSAAKGGGIHASAGITLGNNDISDNSATNIGGGIYTTEDITLTNNTIDSNNAVQGGGGVALYVEDKVLSADGNNFSNNSEYAILLHSNASWEDNGGNTFSANTPDDIDQAD
ncbi:MAG: nitrous oxide reductase family maturation protein NosD [Halanaerobiales bacterium]